MGCKSGNRPVLNPLFEFENCSMSKKSRRRKRRAPRVRRKSQPGASPGTIAPAADALRPIVHVISYGPDEIHESSIDNLADLKNLVGKLPVTWINVDGVGDAATIEKLGEIFKLHSLALEDVVNVHQRAKVEEYGEHLFIVARMVSRNEHLETEQISFFLGQGFLLTIQEAGGDCLDPVRERIRKARGRIRGAGADYLAYALLDAVVDHYFPIVDDYGDQLEALDDQVAQRETHRTMDELHLVRGDLMLLRRSIRPLRDALVKLMPDPTALISPETQIYVRDCYDHTVQLLDLLDSYREMCSDLREFHVSSISSHMNEIVKVLTIISTIFIPLSFIAGVYGMNFKTEASSWNMPELGWPLGYLFSLGLMGIVAAVLLCYFWRRGWLVQPKL